MSGLGLCVSFEGDENVLVLMEVMVVQIYTLCVGESSDM